MLRVIETLTEYLAYKRMKNSDKEIRNRRKEENGRDVKRYKTNRQINGGQAGYVDKIESRNVFHK